MSVQSATDEALRALKEQHQRYATFLDTVESHFRNARNLVNGNFPVIYAIKTRIKSEAHILEKLERKRKKGEIITPGNIFQQITDYCGVRVLHMHIGQFRDIHQLICKPVDDGDWVFHEKPAANFWDPDLKNFYEEFNLEIRIRETLYTSVHYLVKPRRDSPIICEIQVRTLFEEIWGEVDHYLNYPNPTTNDHCRRQLRVLSKMVCSGSRLVDSIFQSNQESGIPLSYSDTDDKTAPPIRVVNSTVPDEVIATPSAPPGEFKMSDRQKIFRAYLPWKWLWLVLALAWFVLAISHFLGK